MEISSLINRSLTETSEPAIKKHSLTTPPIEDMGIDRVVHIDAAIGATPMPEKKESESLLGVRSPSQKFIVQPIIHQGLLQLKQFNQPTINLVGQSIDKHYMIPIDGIPLGGRFHRFVFYWKASTSHSWPISVIEEGYRNQWSSLTILWKTREKILLSSKEERNLTAVVNQFLEAQVIKRLPSQDGWFLSHLFTVQESNKIRLILDCKRINVYIQCHHFTMEGVPTLRKIIEKDDLIATINLKDSYSSPNSPRVKMVSIFQAQGSNIPLQIFTFWDECGAQSVLQTDEVCYRTTTREEYSAGILPG